MKQIQLLHLLLISMFASAQQSYEYLPEHKGNWAPPIVIAERFTPFTLSAAEKNVLMRKADKAFQLIKVFPSFNPPRGMQMNTVTTMRYIEDHEKAKFKTNAPLPLELQVEMGDYIRQEGKIRLYPRKESYTRIEFYFNDPDAMLSDYALFSERLYDAKGNQYYFEPEIFKVYDSAVVYSNKKMLMVQPGGQLWIPVTAKQYLDALIFHYSRLVKEGQTGNQMVVDNIQKQLNDLPAEDHDKPAYHKSQFDGNLSNLSLIKMTGHTPIVKLNPAYFDKTKQRTDMQLLVVNLGFHTYDYDEPILKIDDRYSNNAVQLYDFLSHFNFKRFQNLLD